MNARRFLSIQRRIHIANSHLHQKTMRGAADVAIFEGPEAIEFLKMASPNEFPPHFLSNPEAKKWIQVVLKGYWNINSDNIQKLHFPKSLITVVKYSGFGAFKYQTQKEADEDLKNNPERMIGIPEINIVTMSEPQPDFVEIIDLDTLQDDDGGADSDWEKCYAGELAQGTLAY